MKKISLLAILFLTLTSCEKFLEEDSRSAISADDFFGSADDAYSAVNSLYRQGFPTFYGTGVNGASRLMTGGFLAGLYDNQYKGEFVVRAQALNVNAGLDNAQLQAIWQSCYEVIVRNANFALKYLPETPGLQDGQRAQLMAEVRFFRALNYFHLVKTFGAVPLITDTYESLDNIYVRRSSEAKVYEQIVSDLTTALETGNLPDSPMPQNGFRISKGSVAALLADVYLNMAGYPLNDEAKYADAATVAKSLIDNGNYGLIQHQNMGSGSAYNTLRTSDNEKEYLYTIEYDDVVTPGGGYPMFCFPQEAATWGEFPNYGMANLGYDPVNILHQVYDEEDDLRYQEKQYFHSSYTQVNGPNAGTVRTFGKPIPYFWWEEEAALETGVSTKDKVHYRLAEMYLIAAEAIAKTQGVTDEAAGYLAQIQHRASMNRSFETIKASLMSLSVQEFVEEVWREKIREFIFEYKIWNDITRTRTYPAVDAAGNRLVLSSVPEKLKVTNVGKWGYVWRYLLRTDFLKKHGLKFEEGRLIEDLPFSLPAVFFAEKLVVVPGAVYTYCLQENSIMTKKDKEHRKRRRRDIQYVKSFRHHFARSHNFKIPGVPTGRISYFYVKWLT